MAKKASRKTSFFDEEIDVRRFRDIHIRFPGDVYVLAVWLALSDRAKSTPTGRTHTTLLGLARKLAGLHGVDYTHPLTAEDVMAVFRQHGITGNPLLRLDDAVAEILVPRAAAISQGRPPTPIARLAGDGEPEPPPTGD